MPVAGALDSLGLRLANVLAGNPQGAGALEISYLGPSLLVEAHSVRIAACGPLRMGVARGGAVEMLEPYRSHLLQRGDVLSLGAVSGAAVAYLAVAGGFDLAPVMGSLSTYLRAAIGPLDGQALREGLALPLCRAGTAGPDVALPQPPDYGEGPFRVVLGPQDDHFTDEALHRLLTEPYRVGKQADRMGLRLDGPPLGHRRGADISSDGLVTGCIQVPGNGQPIVLLADHQTVGGYAKIATVISADLPRLGRLTPGSEVRFRAVTVEQAEEARRRHEQAVAALVAAIAPVRPKGGIDIDALYAENLISGMIDATERRP